jgi:hypothetical protein
MVRLLSSCLLFLGLSAVACGPSSNLPAEYVSIKYTVTPGTTTGDTPLVLTVSPPPGEGGMTCFRTQNQINVYANLGVASVNFLLNSTATVPYQTALEATTQSAGVAVVNMEIPLAIDSGGNPSNPTAFSTTMTGNSLTCELSLGGPDLFASFDGSFTCNTLSTDPGRHLMLTQGQFHAVPCPAGQ